MKKVLVTGGGGFIGLALVKSLIERGVAVRVFGRHYYPEAALLGAVCVVGDLRDAEMVSQATCGCDTVFHVGAKAGIWGPYAEYYAINVQGTENVINGCLQQGVGRLVYTSTPSVVFDGEDLQGVDERTPYASKPLCHYARTKIAAEKLVLGANSTRLLTVAIRPHLVWGPGDTNLIPRLIARGQEGSLRIVGDGTNKVDIAYIDNVVAAHILAAESLESSTRASGNAFFIGQEEPVQLWNWINQLFDAMNIPLVEKSISMKTAWRIGWFLEKIYGILHISREPKMTRFLAEQLALSHWFNKEKATSMLGYREYVTTEKGMAALQRWLVSTDESNVIINNNEMV